MKTISIDTALNRNGHIIGRARLEHRSLSEQERSIIGAVRNYAVTMTNISKKFLNALEMEGEMDRTIVYEPVCVKLRFAHYNSGEHHTPQPDYHVVKSNHPAFPVHGNVGKEEAEKCGIKIPKTPTFEAWVRSGRMCYRG